MKKLLLSIFIASFFSVNNNAKNEFVQIDFNTIDYILSKNAEFEDIIQNDCVYEKFKGYNEARSRGHSVEEATTISYIIYFSCMEAAFLSAE